MSPISVLQFYFSNVTLTFRYTHGQPELDYLFKPSLQLGMTKESPWDEESESASRFWELSLKENLRIIKQKTSEEAEDLNNTTDQSALTEYTEHFTQQQQNEHSSQMDMEYSPG